MSEKIKNNSRRTFLKTIGAMGAGSMLVSMDSPGNASEKKPQSDNLPATVPTRPFGKTGIHVSILSLGGVLSKDDMIVFRQAFKMGVTYWDTADGYGWGKNEKAIGKYFAKFADDRQKIFLVTKAASSDPDELTEKLNQSLKRMNTTYVDMFLIHYVKNAKEELTKEVEAWAKKAKKDGKIRLFGFSAHKNMEANMLVAAKLGWIDGIMMSYNYRLMVKDEMKRAVDACVKAGIGLTAMKTQAAFTANIYASIGSETDMALKMTERFMKSGYTAEQAKLKAVWENPNIASICSAMPDTTILQANAAAATNKVNLSLQDKHLLEHFAQLTSSGYCAGCADICESALECDVPISDIMRYSMYHCSYGQKKEASALFQSLPEPVRARLCNIDYSKAEKRCPQKIEIGSVIKQACEELS